MSCYNNKCYIPQPPRAWTRVQNSCSLTTDIDTFIVPYTNQAVSSSVFEKKMAMLAKGNILQYKANSSNLTKAQRYSKIAKGQWVNRNTTWGTQSTHGYTNPNSTSLKRTGNVVNIAIDPITGAILGPTTAPVTCPQPIIPVNEALPINDGGGTDEPVIPPPPPPPTDPNINDTYIPEVATSVTEPIVIQDGGTLVCSVQENVCTGEIKRSISQQLCNPTTDSDVPGPIDVLCWNDGTPTWYPRQRYIMTNSTNKWPVNATLLSSIRPLPPVITSVTNNGLTVTLTWTQDELCLPVSRFDIYQDGVLVKIVNGTVFTTDIYISDAICSSYQFFIVAGTSGNVVSAPSNTVSICVCISIDPPSSVVITQLGENSGYATATLEWDAPQLIPCIDMFTYNLYLDNVLVVSGITDLFYQFINLEFYKTYTFGVQSSTQVNGVIIESSIINVVGTTIPPFSAPGASWSYNDGSFSIDYTNPDPYSITFYPIIPYILVFMVGGGGGGAGTPSTPPSTTYQLWGSGGGGGGQSILRYNTSSVNQSFSLTVGYGGPGGSTSGSQGGNTTFEGYIVSGGGGGNYGSNLDTVIYGNDGGSGGTITTSGSRTICYGNGGDGGIGGEWPQPRPASGTWPTTYYYAGNGENSYFNVNINSFLFNYPSITNYCGGGAGASLQGGNGGNGVGGAPANSGITNFDGKTYGAGGGAYNNNYNSYNPNLTGGKGKGGIVSIKLYWPIKILPFTYTGNFIITYANSYVLVEFFSSGNLVLNQSVNSSYIVCVGGGAGGGGGTSIESVGAGGGGGGAGVINPGTLGIGNYTITVGTGGTGGQTAVSGVSGGPGTTSSFINSSFVSLITSTGGAGGELYIGPVNGQANGGLGGTVTSSYPIVSGINGGDGGYGIYGTNYFGQNGTSSDIYSSGGYPLPTGNTVYFSGGGGGSKDGSSSYGAGGSAGNGIGGSFGWSQQVSWPEQQDSIQTYQYPLFSETQQAGQSANLIGAGGGGASGINPGGNGAPGLVMLLFAL